MKGHAKGFNRPCPRPEVATADSSDHPIEHHARQPDAPAQPLRSPNTLAKLAGITTRTLVVAADADLLAPPALMRLWARHVKGAQWATVPDAGHAIAWEQPDAFNEIVLRFLKGGRPFPPVP